MKKVILHIATLLICAFTISPVIAQSPSPSATINSTVGPEARAEFRLTHLPAQARLQRRAGFSLMPSTAAASAGGPAFTITPAAAPNLVAVGGGTVGRLTKWTGFTSSNSFLGDSTIFEGKNGLVGIGTDSPTSRLTVAGQIESTFGGFRFPDGTVQTSSAAGALFTVAHDTTLIGNGTLTSPLGIANGGVNTLQLAAGAVTAAKIASGQVVKSLNSLTDNVTLAAGSNITITPSGNTLTIAADGALSTVVHNATLIGEGTSASPLGLAVPLQLNGSSSQATLTVTNIGYVAVRGVSSDDAGVLGESIENEGVRGESIESTGITGFSEGGTGVTGIGGDGTPFGINGISSPGIGVLGYSNSTSSNGSGILGLSNESATGAIAGRFRGNVEILSSLMQPGDLTVAGKLLVTSGMKMFHIDHPLDPENKYLNHAAIESSEVLNVYSGNVTTNDQGDAVVTLPAWFEALNRDFRYQLTVLGTFAQAIVAEKIRGNRFVIKTNAANVEVSWQVTGVRSDATARKYKFEVEEEKPERERGYYLNPDAYGKSEEKSIMYARDPEGMRMLKQRQTEAEQGRRQKPLDR